MTKQLVETMEKQIGKIEKAIRKFTVATNAHDMARRHGINGINEARNQLAGDVHETRQQLESILSTVTEELDAAKAAMCDDATNCLTCELMDYPCPECQRKAFG